jgi:hypothetical protein
MAATAREVAAALHPSAARLPRPGSRAPTARESSRRRHGAKTPAMPSVYTQSRDHSHRDRKRARSPPRHYGRGGSGSSSDGSSDRGGSYGGRGGGYSSSGSSSSDENGGGGYSRPGRSRSRAHGAHDRGHDAGPFAPSSRSGGQGRSGGASLDALRADAAPLDADTRTSWDMV